ncbi:MAG: hypothetical protein ACE5K4_02110 [Candidatus Hydrothermarchaeota archaeon]
MLLRWMCLICSLLAVGYIASGANLSVYVVYKEPVVNTSGYDCKECHMEREVLSRYGRLDLYINRTAYEKTSHNKNCTVCHPYSVKIFYNDTLFIFNLTYCPPSRFRGGFGRENVTRTTRSETCVSEECHEYRELFFGSKHHLAPDIVKMPQYRNASHPEYRPQYCETCHATCSSCHWAGKIQNISGKFTLNISVNIKDHAFTKNITSERCAICHTGEYVFINKSTVEIKGHPQYQEKMASVHKKMECKECHTTIHTLGISEKEKPATCDKCHKIQAEMYKFGPHRIVECTICHSSWLPVSIERGTYKIFLKAYRFGDYASWKTHEVRRKARNCTLCHGNSTIIKEYKERRDIILEKMNSTINMGERAGANMLEAKLKHIEARAAWFHIAPNREELSEETIRLAEKAIGQANITNLIALLAVVTASVVTVLVVLIIWPYEEK